MGGFSCISKFQKLRNSYRILLFNRKKLEKSINPDKGVTYVHSYVGSHLVPSRDKTENIQDSLLFGFIPFPSNTEITTCTENIGEVMTIQVNCNKQFIPNELRPLLCTL